MKHYLIFGTTNLSQYDSLENINEFLFDYETGKIEFEDWTYKIFNHFPTVQEIEEYIKIYNKNMEEEDEVDFNKNFYRVMGFGSIRIFQLQEGYTIEQIRDELPEVGEEIFNKFPTQEQFEKVCKEYEENQNKLANERQAEYDKKLLQNRSYSGSKGIYDIRMDEVMEDTSTKINVDYEGNYPSNSHAPIEKLFDQVTV